MQIVVVPMEEKHLETIAQLEQQCFSLPWSKAMLQEQLDNNQASFLVAENPQTGEILGYSGLHVVLDEGYIDNVATAPNHRKQGVASALLSVYCRFAQEHLSFLTLEVRPSNLAAVALYQKHKFVQEATRKNYYDHPKEDALIMTRRFEDAP